MFCGSITECLPRQVPHLLQRSYGLEYCHIAWIGLCFNIIFHMIKKGALLVQVWCTFISFNFYLFQNNFSSLRVSNGFCSAWKDFSWRPWVVLCILMWIAGSAFFWYDAFIIISSNYFCWTSMFAYLSNLKHSRLLSQSVYSIEISFASFIIFKHFQTNLY